MAGQSLLHGAVILLLASLFNRVIGFIYQILMIRMILPEGVGLFNMVYPIYVMVLVMATAGIPVAISKLVAEETAKNNMLGAYRIFNICFTILIFSSIFFTIVCYIGAPLLNEYIFPNPRVFYIFLYLIPGIIIVSLCSAFRGFFQGLQQMKPTALSQSLEQVVRVALGLYFAYLFLPRGIEYAAIGVALGVVIGEFAGLALITVMFFKTRPMVVPAANSTQPDNLLQSLSRIFNLAVPVTLTRVLATAFMSIEAVLIPQRLQYGGLNVTEATAAYGQFVGISESLLYIPGIITMSLATALIPAVSDATAVNDDRLVQSRCEEAVRITLLAGLPCTVVFLLFAEDLCGIIFGYPEAGMSLRIMALSGPFLYLLQTTTGILQGMGQASKPFRNLLFASVFKIAGIYYLTGMPQIGILGTAAALGASYVIMACLNLNDIRMLTGFKVNFVQDLLKPLIAAAGMAPVMTLTRGFIQLYIEPVAVATAGALFCGLFTYLVLLLVSGGIDSYYLQRFKGLIKL